MKAFWKDIAETCPLAWGELREGALNEKLNRPYLFRNLYDWFDGLGVKVYIYFYSSTGTDTYCIRIKEHFETEGWKWFVESPTQSWQTRTEAEQAAFKRAFQIREEQLKLKQ